MKNKIIIVLVLLLALCSNENKKDDKDRDKIEIYLLNKFIEPIKGDIPVKEFIVAREDLNNDPLIPDSGIVGYKMATYEIVLDPVSCKKISRLEPSLPMGIQFALTLNKKHIITGYFWDKTSSFGTSWYTIIVNDGPAYKIHKGIPEVKSTDIIELRDNIQLVNAFKKTNRIIE